ncbi:arylamine N-acetyltransferase family protein [Ilumatobacter sp.]|uniref:arylamine N-acetyltransferase family protein n=1 Tax=Ilumatobacter sp. TaxID=1967498 RepID=UPI003AF4838A
MVDVDEYLEWIGFGGTPTTDLETLAQLQRLHMTAVPFENLSITQGIHLTTDAEASVDKIVRAGRGGWCFELNGAFAWLLEHLGFRVTLLGAAVLLDGPSEVIEHLTLEVTVDRPYLVDVGFGESFIRPLALNAAGPQDGGNGTYELIGSPQGTTLTRHVDGLPTPEYRFKRVAHRLDDFTAVSDSMQIDPDKQWRAKPFATRLLDGGPDRVTLRTHRLEVVRDGRIDERALDGDEWQRELVDWFGYPYRV